MSRIEYSSVSGKLSAHPQDGVAFASRARLGSWMDVDSTREGKSGILRA